MPRMSAVSLVRLLFSTCFYSYRLIIPLNSLPLAAHTHTHSHNNNDCYVMYKQEYQSSVSWFVGMLQIRQHICCHPDFVVSFF